MGVKSNPAVPPASVTAEFEMDGLAERDTSEPSICSPLAAVYEVPLNVPLKLTCSSWDASRISHGASESATRARNTSPARPRLAAPEAGFTS